MADMSTTAMRLSPSPEQVEALSDAKSETDVAFDFTAELVDVELSRQHLRPKSRGKPAIDGGTLFGLRPARLKDALPDEGQSSFTGSKHRSLTAAEPSELPVFRHLAALEEAVCNGEALAGNIPDLPTALQPANGTSSGKTAPQLFNDVTHANLAIQSARGVSIANYTTGRSLPLRTCGGGLLAKAPIPVQHGTEPRFFFSEEGWGMQAPLVPGARKPAAAAPTGFACSALRGAPLTQCRRGPHASALWISTEKARLRTEMVKPFGSSAAIAFIQNGGPRSIESLRQDLCDPELI